MRSSAGGGGELGPLSNAMIFQSAGASSDLDQEQADIPPWMMDACPYSHSDATYELVKFIPKLVPLDHPDYDAMVPKQAVGKINLYCAHPGNDTIFRERKKMK